MEYPGIALMFMEGNGYNGLWNVLEHDGSARTRMLSLGLMRMESSGRARMAFEMVWPPFWTFADANESAWTCMEMDQDRRQWIVLESHGVLRKFLNSSSFQQLPL